MLASFQRFGFAGRFSLPYIAIDHRPASDITNDIFPS